MGIESLQPSTIIFCIFLTFGSLIVLSLIFPRYGCGALIGLAAFGLLMITDNGGLAIVGAVAVAIVFLFVKFRSSGDVALNIEGDGNHIVINR